MISARNRYNNVMMLAIVSVWVPFAGIIRSRFSGFDLRPSIRAVLTLNGQPPRFGVL